MTADQWPCCVCCDDPTAEDGPTSACVFNGERDRHSWPCEYCDEKECPCCGDVHPSESRAHLLTAERRPNA